ncbi:hypothetical protein OXIME_001684 [Oxyplasma meridianum]|uniref:Transposase n=1 Tax=Oxyplasma meridianum TaxID=3073602 RepID=A0AAX4NJ35_9ARCH
MIPPVKFKPSFTMCPECGKRLTLNSRYGRKLKTSSGIFPIINEIMECSIHGIYRSDILGSIVSPHCTYANDIMIKAAMEMFLDGRSSSEVSLIKETGISDRHVRRLAGMALTIFSEIHEESLDKLRKEIKSYILQIDGTVDSDFAMIVVVRDAISGFVLYAKKCHSESEASIEEIFLTVRERFGIPAGIISDMREGILSAAGNVFPRVPIRICLMHFLRDLGKDLMDELHKALGSAINRAGIKSKLKAILRNMPDYDQVTLYEIEYGYCSKRNTMENMSIRRILEKITSINGSSGYGFPFSLRHLNFFNACKDAMKHLADLREKTDRRETLDLISQIMNNLSKITKNAHTDHMAHDLSDINSLVFQKIRNGFSIPDSGNLSEEKKYDSLKDDPVIHESIGIIMGEFLVYMKTRIEAHIFSAAKHAIDQYTKWESYLYAKNPEGTIPRTNNGIEGFFRRMRRNVRKRCGNIATGNILTQSGVQLALFQNMGNRKYKGIVFGSEDISSVFAKHRKHFRKDEMTRKRKMELVDAGTEKILNNKIPDSPYNNEMWEQYKRV